MRDPAVLGRDAGQDEQGRHRFSRAEWERASTTKGIAVLRQELQRVGYVEGQNLVVTVRNDPEAGVRELVQSNVDVLVAAWSPAALAAKRATSRIPIVAVGPRDPVEQGLVRSLARPGGNVTGISSNVTEDRPGTFASKRLEILNEIAPRASRVAFLTDLSFPGTAPYVSLAERSAASLGVMIQTFDVRTEADVNRAFTDLAGTLMSYAPDLAANFRRGRGLHR